MTSRRELLGSLSAALLLPNGRPLRRLRAANALDDFIRAKMERDHIPGVAACLVDRDGMRWLGTYGFAHLEPRAPMTADRLQNICSISKTFTTAVVMQEVEGGRLHLDADVSDRLPFPVRNPNHPRDKITARLLLTHRSSLRDGAAYSRRYGCGDPSLSLADWMRGYFAPGGADYDARENFHPERPGARWDYCNVAYGLLGLLAETTAGRPFPQLCRERIFEPLGMPDTAWFLSEIDVARHVTPYTYVADGKPRGPAWGGLAQGVLRNGPAPASLADGYHANCPYNHPNYPDGFLRTSVTQLARYARAWLGGGALGSARILQAATTRALFATEHREGGRTQGLTWYATEPVRGELAWGHGGSDPGINTELRLLLREGIGAIAFMNTNGVRPHEITHRILQEAPNLI